MSRLEPNTFYPHGKPEYFAYTEDFVTVGRDKKGLAEAHTKYPGLRDPDKSITEKALSHLRDLISSARAAEVSFITATGLNLNDPESAKEVFDIMNTIFNTKDTINRGIQYMKKLATIRQEDMDDDMALHTYREVTANLQGYLRQQIKSRLENKAFANMVLHMTPDQIKNEVNNIISDALITAYKQAEDFIGPNGEIRSKMGASGTGKAAPMENEEAKQAISDMIDVIETLKGKGAFREYGNLFNIDKKTLLGENKKANKAYNLKGAIKDAEDFDDTEVTSNYQGSALELITSVAAAELASMNIVNKDFIITGLHTGRLNQMKGDSMIFFSKSPVDVSGYTKFINRKGENKDSVRLQNVDAMQQYLKSLEDNVEHVVVISDKNYSIKFDFNGIAAQEKMTLQNAGYMLSRFDVPDIVPLIHYLANCGTSMIQGDRADGEIRTTLQTYIAYFLFDNLHMEFSGGAQPSGPNVVNLMNISGMYVPLSIYLEGVYQAIKGSLFNSPSSLVQVSISLGGPTEESEWTIANWYRFREQHENQSYISYKILQDIADFITKIVNSSL